MEGYDYYDFEGIGQLIEKMREEDVLKCMRAAYHFIDKYCLQCEGEDLFNEALTRVFEGKRRIPKDVKTSTAINQIMKSISSEMIEKRSDEAMRNPVSLDEVPGVEAHNQSLSSTEESLSSTEEQWIYLMSLFKDDESATAFLKATELGLKKSQIIARVYEGDQKAYDTTRRRIKRKAVKQTKESI